MDSPNQQPTKASLPSGICSTIRDQIIDSDRKLCQWWDSLWKHYCLCRLNLECWLSPKSLFPEITVLDSPAKGRWHHVRRAAKPEWAHFLVLPSQLQPSSSASLSSLASSLSTRSTPASSIASAKTADTITLGMAALHTVVAPIASGLPAAAAQTRLESMLEDEEEEQYTTGGDW